MEAQTLERRMAIADRGFACYTTRPQHDGCGAVVVLAELFGLTPHVLAVCDQLAAAGFEVVCPDLLHRTAGAMVLPEDDSGRDAGFAALRELEVDQLVDDVAAATALLSRPVPECGLLGLSVGGYIGFLAATRLPFADIALAYPGWLASTTPPIASSERALDQLDMIRGRILIVVGGDDALIRPAEQTLLRELLHTSEGEILVLPHIGHGFLCPTRPTYDQSGADLAWRRILAHLAPAGLKPQTGPNRGTGTVREG